MLHRVSAAALILSAGLALPAFAADPPKPAAAAAAPTKAEPAKAEAALAVPVAEPAPPKPQPGLITAQMQAEAVANAPPAPPPLAPPVAAPSVAVAAEGLQPAVKPGLKAALVAPAAPVVAAAALSAAPPVAPVAAIAPAVAAEAKPALAPVQLVAVSAPAPFAAPAPAPAPAGSALVARRITDAAGAFDAWTEKAARIDGQFSDAKGVAAALEDSTAFQAQQLEEGAVAYGALVALQDPEFVQSATDLSERGGDHSKAAEILYATPTAAMALPGADTAAAFVGAALAKRASAVLVAGKAVKQAAYSVQASPWAREGITQAEKRLTDAKTRSSATIALDGPASVTLMKRLVELRTSRPAAAAGHAEPTPLVARALALATLVVLGEADEAHSAKLTPLLAEARSNDCLKMAKLNLFQCLSVAGPQYEDVFCIGQHGLSEAGQCLATAAGASLPTPVQAAAPVLLAASAPPAPAGVAVPIAILAEGGPERSAAFAAPPASTPAPAAPVQLAQAAPAAPAYSDAPAWSRDSIARRPQPQVDTQADEPTPRQAPAYARTDRGLAYRWDRQTRDADYARPPAYAPRYPQGDEDRDDGADERYADPRQAYSRYGARRPAAPVDAYGRPYADADEDGPAADERAPAPGVLPNVWGYR